MQWLVVTMTTKLVGKGKGRKTMTLSRFASGGEWRRGGVMVWQVGSKVRATMGDKTSHVPRPDPPEREGAGIHHPKEKGLVSTIYICTYRVGRAWE